MTGVEVNYVLLPKKYISEQKQVWPGWEGNRIINSISLSIALGDKANFSWATKSSGSTFALNTYLHPIGFLSMGWGTNSQFSLVSKSTISSCIATRQAGWYETSNIYLGIETYLEK